MHDRHERRRSNREMIIRENHNATADVVRDGSTLTTGDANSAAAITEETDVVEGVIEVDRVITTMSTTTPHKVRQITASSIGTARLVETDERRNACHVDDASRRIFVDATDASSPKPVAYTIFGRFERILFLWSVPERVYGQSARAEPRRDGLHCRRRN